MLKFKKLWTTFFTELGVSFKDEDYYLWFPHPDSKLQGWGTWVATQPEAMSPVELKKMAEFVAETGHNALAFQGYPWANGYFATKWSIINRGKPEQFVKITIRRAQFRTSPFNGWTQLVNERCVATDEAPGFSREEAELVNEVATSSPVIMNANLKAAYKAAWELEIAGG